MPPGGGSWKDFAPWRRPRNLGCAGSLNRVPVVMRALVPSDLEAVCRVLEAAKLSSGDLHAAQLEHFRGIYEGDVLVAVGGIEPHGRDALLRSVVTTPEARGRGLAGQIVGELEAYARRIGIELICLLTETAEGYFEQSGYEVCRRDQAPATIRGTQQFSELCPDDATFMCKRLRTT